LGIFEEGRPSKNNNKKMSSDMESVPDPKTIKTLHGISDKGKGVTKTAYIFSPEWLTTHWTQE